MAEISRREFLKIATQGIIAASGMLGFGALVRFLGHPTAPPRLTQFDLGLAANYPLDSRTILGAVPAVLVHAETGFSAFSMVCPHLGCTLEQTAGGSTCPCHGSKFGDDGLPQRGPADKPLESLRVEQNAQGHLILHVP